MTTYIIIVYSTHAQDDYKINKEKNTLKNNLKS